MCPCPWPSMCNKNVNMHDGTRSLKFCRKKRGLDQTTKWNLNLQYISSGSVFNPIVSQIPEDKGLEKQFFKMDMTIRSELFCR